jgi:hypothetical protein
MRFRQVTDATTATVVASLALTGADLAGAVAAMTVGGRAVEFVVGLRAGLLVLAWLAASLWLLAIRSNAASLDPEGVDAWPWAFLGWVIPIAWFWIPKAMVDESWETTARGCRDGSQPGSTSGWWCLWVAYTFLEVVALRAALLGTDITHATVFLVPTAILSVAALAAWLPIVRRVSATQHRLVAARAL